METPDQHVLWLLITVSRCCGHTSLLHAGNTWQQRSLGHQEPNKGHANQGKKDKKKTLKKVRFVSIHRQKRLSPYPVRRYIYITVLLYIPSKTWTMGTNFTPTMPHFIFFLHSMSFLRSSSPSSPFPVLSTLWIGWKVLVYDGEQYFIRTRIVFLRPLLHQ